MPFIRIEGVKYGNRIVETGVTYIFFRVYEKSGKPCLPDQPHHLLLRLIYKDMTPPTRKEECNCKEMSCQKDCRERHTHKGFFCEKCEPETSAKMYPKESHQLPKEEKYVCCDCKEPIQVHKCHPLPPKAPEETVQEKGECNECDMNKGYHTGYHESAKPRDIPPTDTGNWEEDFRNKWEGANAGHHYLSIPSRAMNDIIEDIYQILSKALSTARAEERNSLAGEIEKMKVNEDASTGRQARALQTEYNKKHNVALDSILQILRERE